MEASSRGEREGVVLKNGEWRESLEGRHKKRRVVLCIYVNMSRLTTVGHIAMCLSEFR